MPELRSTHLFTASGEIGPPQVVGDTPIGRRMIIPVLGGEFAGPKMQGKVLPGGSDWLLIREDGSFQQDVRLALETDDGHVIGMAYRGVRHASAEVAARLARGEPVDPSEYYFRTAPFFEAGSGPYEWINRVVAVGVGSREPGMVRYDVFEML